MTDEKLAFTECRWHWNAPPEYIQHARWSAWKHMAQGLTEYLQERQGTVIALKMEESERRVPPFGASPYDRNALPPFYWDYEYRVTVTFQQVIDRSPLYVMDMPPSMWAAPPDQSTRALVRELWGRVKRAYWRELKLAREGYAKEETSDSERFFRWGY